MGKFIYDKKKIKKMIREFKKRKINIKDLNLFFDMDNTLCLFSQRGEDMKYLLLSDEKGFFEKLPIFHSVKDTLMTLHHLGAKIWILSLYPEREWDKKSAKIEKNNWINENLPFIPKKRRLLYPVGVNKGEIINSVCDVNTAIIVDDYGENIINAYEAGAIGIKKTYSGKKRPCPQIKQFYDLLDVLKELNVQGF